MLIRSLFASAAIFSFSAAAATPLFNISGFSVRGNTLLSEAEVDAALAPYKGASRDFTSVQKAVESLQAAYAKRGYNLVRVSLPEQELNQGLVRVEVAEARIGKVIVEGNKHFDAASIRRSVPGLVEGGKPNVGRVSASLAQANENPAKKTTLNFQSGAEGEVDARLAVVDEKPWRVSLNADNTGSEETGRVMVGLSYQNSNVFGRDHVASLQYTTTDKYERVSVYGFGYHIPLYGLGDSIDLYASHSDVDSGTVLAGTFTMALTGKGTVAGARYNHAFARSGPFQSSATLGFDHKVFDNGALLLDVDLGKDITVNPLSLAYGGTWTGADSATTFTISASRNIPGGNHGRAEDFDSARLDARANYSLARYGVSHAAALAQDWQLRLLLSGQYSRDQLIPGEQFGAGGVTSVRGFTNRDISGDSGHTATVEVYTPNQCERWAGVMCRWVFFYDGGRVTRNDPLPGEPARASIGSVGLALRAAIGQHAMLQLDYGHVVDAGFFTSRDEQRLNFRLTLTY